MATRLVFTGKQQVQFETFETNVPGPGQVAVRTLVSLMSTGTENIVFNRLFAPGTHWDNWVKYPFYPGYSVVGEATAVGEGVTKMAVGDRVVLRKGHASDHVVDEADCVVAPKTLAPEAAAWFALAKIAAMGARGAAVKLGETVLVIGAGPIGQMALRWSLAAGAGRVIVADMVPLRLELAKRGGATVTVAEPIETAAEKITAANGGALPDVVIDTTGNSNVFTSALRLVRTQGRMVLLGDTGSPDEQHLIPDVICRSLSIVGAHDGTEDAHWNKEIICALFFAFAGDGRFRMDGLNTHVFKPEQCAEAYATANTRRGETKGILFDWR